MYRIGEEGHAVRAYLNIKEIIRVAKDSDVDAIHRDCGFLSENPDLARACDETETAFGNPTVFRERTVLRLRQIEIQVLSAGLVRVPMVGIKTETTHGVEDARARPRSPAEARQGRDEGHCEKTHD